MIDHCGLVWGWPRPEPSLGPRAKNVIIPLDLTQLSCPGFTLAAGLPSGFTTDGVGCWGEPCGDPAISLHSHHALFEKQNWIVGHRWNFPFHRKKNNTQGLGEYKFLSCTWIQPFWSRKKFKFWFLFPSWIIPSVWYLRREIIPCIDGNSWCGRGGRTTHTIYCTYNWKSFPNMEHLPCQAGALSQTDLSEQAQLGSM